MSVRFDVATFAAIEAEARRERRSMANYCRVLIGEARALRLTVKQNGRAA